RPQQPGEATQQRRLARAVGPHDGLAFAPDHVEVERPEDGAAPGVPFEVAGGEEGGHRPPPRPSPPRPSSPAPSLPTSPGEEGGRKTNFVVCCCFPLSRRGGEGGGGRGARGE